MFSPLFPGIEPDNPTIEFSRSRNSTFKFLNFSKKIFSEKFSEKNLIFIIK